MLDDVRKERRARVFRNGRSRAVRIPKEFEFEGDEVTIRKEADGSIRLVPDRKRMSPRELVEWLRSQPPLDEEFPDIEDFPPAPVDLDKPE
jgi:antitoxin VapB